MTECSSASYFSMICSVIRKSQAVKWQIARPRRHSNSVQTGRDLTKETKKTRLETIVALCVYSFFKIQGA